MSSVVWHWQVSPREALRGYKIWDGVSTVAPAVEAIPFSVPRESFGAHLKRDFDEPVELEFQWGVSSKSRAHDMQAVREFAPGLQDTGSTAVMPKGDPRSGIIVLEGERIVGSYIIDGIRGNPPPQHRVWIHRDFYGSQMGSKVLLEYQKRIPRCEARKQNLNPRGAETFLAVRPMLYAWAREQGHTLSPAVQREMETGAEAAEIRRMIASVKETGQPLII